jgi:hypothetical protein
MADNLKLVEERIDVEIDPTGAPGSVLAENHNAIEKEILRKSGKYVGSPFTAKKESTLFPSGTLSWNGNAMNNTADFTITTSKKTSDLTDFGKTLSKMETGDLFQFKDYSGRTCFLEFQSFGSGADGSMNEIYNILVKGFSDNINYIYQVNETSTSILSTIKKITDITGKTDKGTFEGTAGELDERIKVLEDFQSIKTGFTGEALAVWTGVGYVFDVIYPNYYIQGVAFPGATVQRTLDASDPDDPRFDVIAVDATGAIVKTGTAEANPLVPSIDPETEIQITVILVTAGSTVPEDISQEFVYDENTEWTTASNNGTVNFNATSNPFQGTKHIDCGAFANGQYLRFTDSVVNQITDFTILKFYVNLKAVFSTNTKFSVKFYNGSTLISSVLQIGTGTFNFDRSIINTYQTILIPLTNFTFSNADFNRIEIAMVGSNSSGFRLDDIVLLTGTTGSSPAQKALVSIVTDSGTANATSADDTFILKGANGAVVSATGKTITITPATPTVSSVTGLQGELDLKASKTYVDGLVVGLLDDRGNYDASTNLFPSTGGSGTAGALLKGDLWYISVSGTLGGQIVDVGDSIRALTDAPGQTSGNWDILESNIGYVPENTSNKSTDVETDKTSNIKFPTVKSIYDWCVGRFQPKLVAGTSITIDNTNPLAPVINGTAVSQDIETDKASTTKVSSVKQLYDWAVAKFMSLYIGIESTSAITYTFNLANIFKRTVFTGSNPVALTIPTNATVAVPIGTKKEVTQQGSGIVTASGAGITFVNNIPLAFMQGETKVFTKIDTDTWTVEGNFPVAGALEFKKCYLKGTGNDSTAIIGSGSNPFLTLEGLILRVIAVYGNFNDVEIIILDSGSYNINEARTYSDLVIKTTFSPSVRFSAYTWVTKKLHFEGQFYLELNPRVGAVSGGTPYLSAPSGVNTSIYINIKEINKGAQGYSPTCHFQAFGTTQLLCFKVGTMSGAGRFNFEGAVGTKELYIDTLKDGTVEFYGGDNQYNCTINIRQIYYEGSGQYNPFSIGFSYATIKLGGITVTNNAGFVVLSPSLNLVLTGGIYQNLLFNGYSGVTSEVNCGLTGIGTIQFKSAVNGVAPWGVIHFGSSPIRTKLYNNRIKNLNLTYTDTNSGAYLNSSNGIFSWITNGTTDFANCLLLDNVFITVQLSTIAMFFSGNGSSENVNYPNVVFKNGCQFRGLGYFYKNRSGFGLADVTGRTILARLGNGGLLRDDIGLTNTVTGLAIVDL